MKNKRYIRLAKKLKGNCINNTTFCDGCKLFEWDTDNNICFKTMEGYQELCPNDLSLREMIEMCKGGNKNEER